MCYLGILVLFSLAILPPALRMFLPDKGEEKKEEIPERSVLYCSSNKFITNTSYENNKIQMILLKKINQVSENNGETIDDKSELILKFQDLKDKSTIIYTETEDGGVIQIDFSISNNDNLDIKSLTKKIEEQKKYYEQQGLNCLIRK